MSSIGAARTAAFRLFIHNAKCYGRDNARRAWAGEKIRIEVVAMELRGIRAVYMYIVSATLDFAARR